MARASDIFDQAARDRVQGAIDEAEGGTAAEIVVVVATRSGRYDRAEDLFGIAVGLAAAAVAVLAVTATGSSGAQWGASNSAAWTASITVLAFLLGFVAGTAVAARRFPLARPFLRRTEMLDEVSRSAIEAYHQLRVGRTRDGTGMLIYISVSERLVRVVPDDAVNKRVDAAVWDTARDRIVDGFRAREPVDGLIAAIAVCAGPLAEAFPAADDDVNELTNELVVID